MNQDDDDDVYLTTNTNHHVPAKRAFKSIQHNYMQSETSNDQPPTKRRKFNLSKQLHLLMLNEVYDLES